MGYSSPVSIHGALPPLQVSEPLVNAFLTTPSKRGHAPLHGMFNFWKFCSLFLCLLVQRL